MANPEELLDGVCLLSKYSDKLKRSNSLPLTKCSRLVPLTSSDQLTKELGSDFVFVKNSNPELDTVGIYENKQYQENKQRTNMTYFEKSKDQNDDRKADQRMEEKEISFFESNNDEGLFRPKKYHIGSQRTHSYDNLLALKSINRVKEIQGFQTSDAKDSSFQKVQSLTRIKERPSTESSVILSVTENLISIDVGQQIDVATSTEDRLEGWEVESGFSIFQSLNPIAYSPSRGKMGSLAASKHSREERISKLYDKEKYDTLHLGTRICMEFLSPVEFSKLFVTNTIDQARETYTNKVVHYGEPQDETWRVVPPITSMHWSSIKQISIEDGIFLIEKYIVEKNSFRENWKYTIWLEGIQSDKSSDHYFYSANFSLPTILYPIAQVTAGLCFHMEVSRVIPPKCPIKVRFSIEGSNLQINPDSFILNDKFLCRVLDAKVKIFKSCII